MSCPDRQLAAKVVTVARSPGAGAPPTDTVERLRAAFLAVTLAAVVVLSALAEAG